MINITAIESRQNTNSFHSKMCGDGYDKTVETIGSLKIDIYTLQQSGDSMVLPPALSPDFHSSKKFFEQYIDSMKKPGEKI